MFDWTGRYLTQRRERQVSVHSDLSGVAALSASDAWAVGAGPGSPAANTLVLRWNGSTWTRVPSPSPHPAQGSSLTSVSALTPRDAVAVGDGAGRSPTDFTPIALRWNGTRWSTVPVPRPSDRTGLASVSADTPADAWAVGSFFVGQREQGFIVHWNGSTWTRVPSPNPGPEVTNLTGVSAVSRTDAWAVGTYAVSRQSKTLVLHWNGSKWAQVPSPSPSQTSGLTGVSALSSRDAWAVGDTPAGTLVLHWNGTSWARMAAPSPGRFASSLNAVSADSSSDAWAVGLDRARGGGHTLILHWDGTRWLRS